MPADASVRPCPRWDEPPPAPYCGPRSRAEGTRIEDAELQFEQTAAAVSHELTTPLTVAKAAVMSLAAALTDDGQAELADTALRSLRAVELQVARLRGLDGPRAQALDRRCHDLVRLARELIDDLQITVLHDHPTQLDAPGELPAEVDADQVRQVLYNLLSNAAKYSPRDRTIVVGIAPVGDDARVEVRDQGEGVAPDDAERIFDRYERADAEAPGAGLGLYLAREIANAHGGSLELVPAEGEGSIFRVTLPRRA